MDQMWNTTWYEEMLFAGFFLLLIFSLLLLIYAIGVTALVCMDKYSAEAAGFYWIYVGITFILFVSGFGLFGIQFFVYCSPLVAFVMRRLERSRNRNHNTTTNE